MQFLNAFLKIEGIGAKRIRHILSQFENAEHAWKASEKEIANCGLPSKITEKIISERKKINPIQEWEKLAREDILLIDENDSAYPPLLKEIPDSPYSIFAKGNINALANHQVAVVGSRKFTVYGKQAAVFFSSELSKYGIGVTSGLAIGIDSIAHWSCLESGGTTVAVLGSSIDKKSIYPRSNYSLAQKIIESGGVLVSEYPPETKASIGTFPARNRIMAGLSLGTLVIEAGIKSGTLITANLTLDYGRELFALPGSIFSSQSEGANYLIKRGAKATTSIQDIIEELPIENISNNSVSNSYSPDTKEEGQVYRVLSKEPIHIDIIIKATKLETSIVSSCLSILEMKGVIKNIGMQNYIKF